ncbi:MAG: hypothetical protein LRZ97_01345 [Candidatus Pacebacteria bacterium]|nr:hypothetical protein [Candidatus Paceibacterota bacterium]
MTKTKGNTKNTQLNYNITKFQELKGTSEVNITVEVSAETFNTYYEQALKHFAKAVKVDGFRAGKAPKDMVIKQVGEQAVQEEAANMVLKDTYPEVLKEKELLIIDAPVIKLSPIKAGEPLEYTLSAPVPPVFKTPEYKKLSKKIFNKAIESDVTGKELADSILDLRRRRKQIELVQKNIAPEKAQTEAEKIAEKDLPELDNKFLETLGGFKSLDEFKVQLKSTIKKDKDAKELNRRRAEFVEAVVSNTTIALPTVLIGHELDRLQSQFETDLQQVGSTLNTYLKSINKSSEDFLEELKPQAQKQAKLQLILNKIAEEESLIPEAKAVDAEVTHLLEHHKDANEDSVRAYVTMQMRNQMVFNFLENHIE